MSVRKIWRIKNSEITEDIINCCNGNKVLAVLLKNRGIDTPAKIQQFLNPLKNKLISPDVFSDMDKASKRIIQSIEKQEHITIYGDFDADGITSTALLYLTLKRIGANVDFYIPERESESHGLNTKALIKLISKKKTKLIITVDCGISNVDEIKFANSFKTDVIITDHHESPEILPDAYAIINPKVENSLDKSLSFEEIENLTHLAGVGVSFKLSCKLLEIFNQQDFVHEILPLAAIGTIGDVVELIGENRSIVAMGLELIKNGKNKGIQKLLKIMGINDYSLVNSDTIAFGIVPRLNAAGRLESPITALNVLISDDEITIDNSVKLLNDLNTLRQQLCDEVFENAKLLYNQHISENQNSIILINNDWNIGIIGIVCSKLVELYNKPVFLMTRDSNNSNIIRCSCRSIPNLNIHTILSQHKEIFEGFGGHKMAAGFSFDENKISFEKFKSILTKTIEEFSLDIDFNQSYIDVDMELTPEDINIETIELIEKMQPFGTSNPLPLFAMKNVLLNNFKMIGTNNNHLKLFVSKNDSNLFECIKWNYPDFNLPLNSQIDILFSLKINLFNNNKNIQLMLSDIFSEKLANNSNSIKILDHRNKKNILAQVIDFIGDTKKKTYIYIQNSLLLKNLNLPDSIQNKVFTNHNIPNDAEQLMFFEIPFSFEEFQKIIKSSNAQIIHLMNFDYSLLNTETFITKISGMLKYALKNIKGSVNIPKIANALNVSEDIVDCSLELFSEISMIEYTQECKDNYKILNIHPIELSKIKKNQLYCEIESNIENINKFKNYYLKSSIEKIKSDLVNN